MAPAATFGAADTSTSLDPMTPMSRPAWLFACVAPLLFPFPSSGLAQGALPAALDDPGVRSALAHVEAGAPATARLLARIGGVVSPSGAEHERAAMVAAHMRRIGLKRVEVDEAPNAVGVLPGRSGASVVFVSTLDDLATVPEHQRAAGPPRIAGDRVVGPGTNTSATTAAMLAAAEAILASGLEPEHTLVFAAVAQEETGLNGMRALYDRFGEGAVAVVDILGDGRSISYGALGIHWWKVRAHGPPGHTLRGALPNVNQGIGRAVDRILQLPEARQRADSGAVVNISILESGSVFNHKPAEGWFSVDIRSLDGDRVRAVEREIRAILDRTGSETGVGFKMEKFRTMPGGQIPGALESQLVRTAESIATHLGLEPALSNAGSSNINIAIGGGTPGIGLGGSRGGERGHADEWADIPAMMRSASHVVLLAATIGGARAGPR